ncbi:hypothetical protein [Rhodococcus erythropolis]|uniref:Transposase n=1 Tax=Rhodococcus erythropolis TaxID=1833 RepID=A0AAX3ZYM2_RHOER|nr:hypothetical protein [Rhodococcus erythropolis]WMN02137.1 hypothetical protein QIE55_32930 [Rhodococcus erythropolis]WMN03112.1 hypothetical protein QIE55_32420 [Rhodococcus erythropolis]
MTVLEVDRPENFDRRRKGKGDDLDAINAALAVKSTRHTTILKSKFDAVESLRVLRVTHAHAV